MPSRLDCFNKDNERSYLIGVDYYKRDIEDPGYEYNPSSAHLGLYRSDIPKVSSDMDGSYSSWIPSGISLKSYRTTLEERMPSQLCY